MITRILPGNSCESPPNLPSLESSLAPSVELSSYTDTGKMQSFYGNGRGI